MGKRGSSKHSAGMLHRAWGSAQAQRMIGWDQAIVLFRDHLGLNSDPGFGDNMHSLLLEAP